MSTLRVNKLENTNTSNGGISIDTSGHVSIDGTNFPTAGPLSNRNLIINGAMQVAQRGTQVTTVTTAGYKSLDRMRYSQNNLTNAEVTIEQSTDAPDGFSYSSKITVTQAEGSVDASDAFRPIEYRIEGQDLQHLQYGTSGAKSLTLSFYVKTSVNGTYTVAFYRDESTDRLITATYTITEAEAGIWQYKTITIPGDTSASITNDNVNRFAVYFHAGAGTNFTSTDSSGSWGNYSGSGFAYGSTVNLQNTENATWQATGIQLEVGETATPFEHRSYGDELTKCQRYYHKMLIGGSNNVLLTFTRYSGGTGRAYHTVALPTTMRTGPSFSTSGTFVTGTGYVGTPILSSNGGTNDSTVSYALLGSSSTSVPANNTWFCEGTSSLTALNFDSEL